MTTVTDSESRAEWLRVDEVAEIFRVSRGVIYAMVASGELPSRRFGRLVRVHRSAVTPSGEDR